ncbi:MAG TPA: AI-2E family transporter [Clostridiaceae bacterium]
MKRKIKIGFVILIFFALVVVILLSPILKDVIFVLFISFLISYALKPLYIFLIKKRLKRKFAAASVIILLSSLLIIVCSILIPTLINESKNMGNSYKYFESYINSLSEHLKFLHSNQTGAIFIDRAYEKLNVIIANKFGDFIDSFINLTESAISLAIAPIVIYYFLSDGKYIENRLLLFISIRYRYLVKKILVELDTVLSKYVVNQLLLCIFVGITTFLILFFLHVKSPLLLAIINATFDLIPYFGPLFGAIPAIIIAATQSPTTALYTAICLYILQQVEGDILSPKLTSDTVNLHPLSVILILIIGGEAGGLLGMIIAVPVGVIVKIIYNDVNYYLF